MHTNSVNTQYAIGVSFFDAFNLGRFKSLSQDDNRRLCGVLNNRQHLFSGAKSSNSLQLGKQFNHRGLWNISNNNSSNKHRRVERGEFGFISNAKNVQSVN